MRFASGAEFKDDTPHRRQGKFVAASAVLIAVDVARNSLLACDIWVTCRPAVTGDRRNVSRMHGLAQIGTGFIRLEQALAP